MSDNHMRAAQLRAPGTVAMVRAKRPSPGAGEVLIRVEGCGVCASNLLPWQGSEWIDYPLPPGALGHEAWGVVETVGADVTDLMRGDRVAALSAASYAEYDVAPADACVRLPPELDGRPFPGEAIACAFNIFRRSLIEPGQTVAIIGIGFLGAILTRLASRAGARVIAISRRATSLDLAEHFGAANQIPMDHHQTIIEQVYALTDGRGCDCVIEAVGKQWPLDLAGELVREGGRLVIAGYHQDGPRQVNMQMWNWKGIDIVSAHERDPAVQRRGLKEAVTAVAAGWLDPTPLYSGGFPIERLGEALDATADKPAGFVKVWVTFA
ncbi:MDR/zinc-dependent alcohol dehydrogenase-like family protein [Sphingomonas sp.]|uniref:MDR/zinc-dependent alcohol dehydrogenase-like family protein n=1 Tax=Sphingomonas sp. TaxID=28214 RepID=UPI002B577AEC|nr:zinc-binding dehydrogenase [Sphingomonas sp.]HTG37623.1 zinc-binding dehydrogenase [Sphingomonas sp.]